jgi:DNA-binding MarR family transcriptional regulator
MKTLKRISGQAPDYDFGLWRILDHTRFMVARLRELELANYGLTLEQSHVLYILDQSGGSSTINDIVDITMRQHHSISTLINRMTKQMLVSKRKDPRDNRKYEVAITRKGQSLVDKLTRDSIHKVFSCLSEQEKKELEMRLKCLLDKAYQMQDKSYTPFPVD